MNRVGAAQLWGVIKAWYAKHVPEVLESLHPGADEGALSEFEAELNREIGKGLPQGLRDVYLKNDEQNRAVVVVCGVFFGLQFLSLNEVLRNWRVWCELARDLFYADMTEFSSFYPADALQHKYAAAGWIPFAHDGGGDHLGVDLSPGLAGQVGQVINFGADEEHKVVIASSFEAFLGWQLGQLQNGNFRIIAESYDGQLERRVELRNPLNTHFLDVVPKLFGSK